MRAKLCLAGLAVLWAAPTVTAQAPRAELLGHSERVEALAFSSDGKRLVSGGFDRVIAVWDVVNGKQAEFRTPQGPIPAIIVGGVPITAVAFAPEPPADPLRLGARKRPERATIASIGSDRSVALWDGDAGMLLGKLPAIAKPVVGLSFDAQGRMLATAAWEDQKGARLFEVGNGTDRASYHEYTELPRSISFTPDGKTLALGDFNGRITILAFLRGGWIVRNAIQGHSDTVWSTSFSADGKILATGGGQGRVRLWDANDGHLLATINPAHRGGVRALAFSPDDKTLATGGVDAVVRLWDVPQVLAAGSTPPDADPGPESPARIDTENENP